MNWALVILAFILGKIASGRDLTTWGEASPTAPPARPPTRPARVTPTARPGRPTPSPTVPASTAPASAPPWPQAVPSGLPAWPDGWEPDEPVGAGVASRAAALLPQLWAHGEGTRKTEQTQGRWITYVARGMGSKRGVVAFRPKPGHVAPPAPTPESAFMPASTTPGFMPGSRTLRRGDEGSDVYYLQGRLGVRIDGKFGPGTEAAVRTWQGTHGLTPDGVVGPKTWGKLLAVTA